MILTETTTTSDLTCSLTSSASLREAKDEITVNGPSGQYVTISFQRTLRVPDGTGVSELPPSMGSFPLYSVAQYKGTLSNAMTLKGGLFFPMYQREAMWINFRSNGRFAIKIHLGGVNAVSGEPLIENAATRLRRLNLLACKLSIQDYVVTPKQSWLDGIASHDGRVRQFVAMSLGSGYSVEAQVTGKELVGGLQFMITPAKFDPPALPTYSPLQQVLNVPDYAKFPLNEVIVKMLTGNSFLIQGLSPSTKVSQLKTMIAHTKGIPTDQQRLIYSDMQLQDGRSLGNYGVHNESSIYLILRLRGGGPPPPTVTGMELGVAPGGLIKQCILEDKYPASIWERHRTICFNVQILHSDIFRTVTGKHPPETPVSAEAYAARGLPFFKIYNEVSAVKGDFKGIKSVKEIDKAKNPGSGKSMKSDSEKEATYPQPPLKNPVILLNPDGVKMEFRPVSELERELASMNAVQF